MESLPKYTCFDYNEDTLEAVRKTINLHKPGMMKAAVDILEQWVKKQHHFNKKSFDRRYLETTILVSKGSVEKAKSKLDRACTIRTLMPHLFEIHNIRDDVKTVLFDLKLGFLPSLTKDHDRVFIYRNVGQKFGPNVVPYFLRNSSTDCCGLRLKAVYFISSSKLIEIVVGLFKQVISAKLGARLHILKDRESLKEVIDEKILPKEYGGTEKSLDEMQEDWLDAVTSEDHKAYLKDIFSASTDESLRQKDTFNEQYLGMPGTFRNISLD